MSRTAIRCPWSWGRAGAATRPKPTTVNAAMSRMSGALLFEAGRDPRRSSLVAFAHFVDQCDGVLQQTDLRLEAVDQALLRRLARRLRAHGRPALADRLIDDGEVLLQRRRRSR